MNVIMFHSVGLRRLEWVSPQIAEDIVPFGGKLDAVARLGHPSYFFSDDVVHDLDRAHAGTCLTFDDGYLDNWVHVFPALRDRNLKATIFVSTDFIDPREIRRPLVESGLVVDGEHVAENCCAGFLSWPEMRELEASGLVQIESHARTHTWYPQSHEIVDYWRPGSATRFAGPVWMLWNELPEEKPFYLTRAAELESRIPWGTPIYAHEKSLAVRRWIPDEDDVVEALHALVRDEGGATFFEREDWKDHLDQRVRLQRDTRSSGAAAGRFESKDEWAARIDDELVGSRRILESGLSRPVRSIAWPGGGVSDALFDRAVAAGYDRFTRPLGIRRPGIPPRMGSVPRIHFRGRDIGHPSSREFEWMMRSAEGDSSARLRLKFARLARVLAYPTGVWR